LYLLILVAKMHLRDM